MCIGNNPLKRATPYLIMGITTLAMTALLFLVSYLKKWKSKYILVIKIILIMVSLLLLLKSFIEYTTIYKCT
jgi:hypothetical protein